MRMHTKMTIELKTLKDLNGLGYGIEQGFYSDSFMIDSHKLKQELGIKWIKAFESGECHTDFAADGRNGQENIIEWIKHVLNITEEDLK